MTDMSRSTGLDHLLAVIAGEVPPSPMSQTLNFRLTEAARGAVALRGAPTEAATNTMGDVHGGWCGTLADSAMGSAVISTLAPGEVHRTLEYKVNLTRAVPVGCEVEARAQVQHVGRSTAVAVTEIRGVADNRLYATGSTTCLVMRLRG